MKVKATTERPELAPVQWAFLDKRLKLYQERQALAHYSDVAARIGVNRFPTCDMLRALEKRFCLIELCPGGGAHGSRPLPEGPCARTGSRS